MKEIVMTELCPGCLQQDGSDNPLRAAPGSFNGTYCLKPGTTDKGHVYGDTGELREELTKANKLRKAKAKAAEPTARTAPEEPKQEVISTVESKAFEVTEMDAERLSELLGQPITDGGTLVGACYSLKMDAGTQETALARKAVSIATIGTDIAIQQKNDGTLQVQVFLPWPIGKSMAEKAIFNNVPLNEIVQGILEYVMAGNSFPWDVQDSGEVLPPYLGFWMVVEVPELYVGTLIDKAAEMGITPTQFVQAFVMDSIGKEQLV